MHANLSPAQPAVSLPHLPPYALFINLRSLHANELKQEDDQTRV